MQHLGCVQVFVANPNKPQPIIDILTNNKEKLLKYLEDFHTDRGEDDACAHSAQQRRPSCVLARMVASRAPQVTCPRRVHGADESDEMFKEEKAVLIREISMLGAPPPAALAPAPPPDASAAAQQPE